MTQAEHAAPDRQAEAVAALAEAIRAAGASSGHAATGSPAPTGPEAAGAAAGLPAADEQRAAALAAAGEVLAAGGAPAALAAPAVAALGEHAAEQLREDPWAVLVLPGVRPEQADAFARGLLGRDAGPGDPRRARALVPWLLEQAALRGHSAQEITEVAAGLQRLGLPEPAAALQEVVVDGRVMAFQEELPGHHGSDEEEPPTRTLLALERLALAEESLGEGLVRVLSTLVPGSDAPADAPADGDGDEDGETGAGEAGAGAETEGADRAPTDEAAPEVAPEVTPDAAGEESGGAGAAAAPDTADGPGTGRPPARPGPTAWAAAAEAAPSPSAAALIRAVADSALVVHTGGEASRAELAALLAAADGLGLRAWAAPWTDHGRTTLAGLLTGSPAAGRITVLGDLLTGEAGPGRSEDGTLALDVLVVPDAQLLDVELAATLLEAVGDGTRLVLSADPAQLWSAGPGRFPADLVAARACPVVASRTPDPGPIGELASGVSVGELEPVDAPDREVVLLTAQTAEEAVHRAVQLLADSIPRALGIPPEEVVLLTPAHGGGAGTRALNAAAKARLNPGPGAFGGFDPGDRVAWSPAPGVTLPGRVLDGDAAGLHLELSDGSRLTLSPAQAVRLRHGWALTAHQAAGRRWPGVVTVVPGDAAGLTRQWVYTAFGRAERHLSVVHPAGPLLAQAVAERPAAERTTRLRTILAEQAGQEY